jgi:hypothetical protein
MGITKTLFMEEREFPPHIEEQNDGKKLWIIEGYRIWAENYEQALNLLSLIKSF